MDQIICVDEIEHECKPRLKKRSSTIDVVNCDETVEYSDAGSFCGPHPLHLKGDDDLEVVEGDSIIEGNDDFDLKEMAAGVMRHAEELVRRMLLTVSWTICHFHSLPRFVTYIIICQL